MKIFTPAKLIVYVFGMAVAFSSCRKANEETTDNADTVANTNQILVTFPKTSLDISTTDSVVAVFFDAGSRTFTKKGSRAGSFYTIPLDGLAQGNWQSNIKVYTMPTKDVGARMYRYQSTINSATSSSLVGPNGKLNDSWKTNLLLNDRNFSVKIVIAVSPTDPYYELTLPPTLLNYQNVYIDRYIYRNVDSTDYVVAYGNAIIKAADNKGTTVNTTTFAPMAAAMTGQTWTTADVSVQLFNNTGNSYREIFKQTIINQ
ncbi:hypothetical protein ACFQ3S_05520 [Mucilaginibacter terrae]|uniref:hypothetical protein n=1 Tax=Mucilaginibacter terrae TaxID=1955052 RepID=UPI00362F0313